MSFPYYGLALLKAGLNVNDPLVFAAPPAEGKDTQPRDGVDPRILQLCDAGGILLDEVSKALQGMGISPGYVMVKDFPPNIVDELVAHWQEVRNHINEMRIPF